MARGTRKPLLSLETFQQQTYTVEIDGKAYPFIGKRDVGFRTWARLTQLYQRVQALEDVTDENDDRWEELDAAVREMVRIVVPSLPDDVLDRLNPFQQLQIVQAFTEAVNPTAQPATGTPQATN